MRAANNTIRTTEPADDPSKRRLKPEELQYFMNRTVDYESEQVQNLRVKTFHNVKGLTNEERFELVRSGQAKLKKEIRGLDPAARIGDVFDFSPFEKEKHAADRRFRDARVALGERVQKTRDRLQKCMATEAKGLIEAMESGK